MNEFWEHLKHGATTLCRCWAVRRRDGTTLGFTGHDCDLLFEGITFRANSALSTDALQQNTGLSVDNGEVVGALTDSTISETDIRIGLFDGAEVTWWLVNWANPMIRKVQFRGTIGEIRYELGSFRAELRGLTEALNQPQGLVYQSQCSAVLGDRRCRARMSSERNSVDVQVQSVSNRKVLVFSGLAEFGKTWFEHGRVVVLTGLGKGLSGIIKSDRAIGGQSHIELWEQIRVSISAGDEIRLEAGCDKRLETCRTKFGNHHNYRGFPHIPGEDWLMSHPASAKVNTGGKLRE